MFKPQTTHGGVCVDADDLLIHVPVLRHADVVLSPAAERQVALVAHDLHGNVRLVLLHRGATVRRHDLHLGKQSHSTIDH